jgi:hypothetical protein
VKIEFFWSRRALCRLIGLGVMLLSVALLMGKLAIAFADSLAPFWLVMIFAGMAAAAGALALWMSIPSIDKLKRASEPALTVHPKGIDWFDVLPKSLRFEEVRAATFVERSSDGETIRTLDLSLHREGPPETINVTQIRGNFHRLAADINRALAGGTPWTQKREYIPNEISKPDRVTYLLGGTLLAAYAVWGLSIDDIYIPGKRSGGLHFHGASAALMAAALLMAAAVFLIEVADHFDRRNNEHWYDNVSCTVICAGWLCAVAAYWIQ